MELIVFNRNNTRQEMRGESTLSVSIHGGIFSFSQKAIKELGLKKGSKILIAQQKDNPKKWFFTQVMDSTDAFAFELSTDKDKLVFRNSFLSKKILASFKEEKRVCFLVSRDKITYGVNSYYVLIPIVGQKTAKSVK